MNKHWKLIAIVFPILVLAIPITLSAIENASASDKNNKQHENEEGEFSDFQEASVHDPSIIKEGDTYYVFGTHIDRKSVV